MLCLIYLVLIISNQMLYTRIMKQKKYISIIFFIIFVILLALIIVYTQRYKRIKNNTVPISSVSYVCNGGKAIKASFYRGESKPSTSPDQPPVPGGSVKLNLSDGRDFTLIQTISADGSRYANPDESFVFWSKGNGALVLENNQEKSYIGCIQVADDPGGLTQVFESGSEGFSIRYPDSYTIDPKYKYQTLGPGKEIVGIKFTIPRVIAEGTNLGEDSYVSVEQIPNSLNCNANNFLSGSNVSTSTINDRDFTYSVASSTDAGLGNRYEEMVYALPGTNPCLAIRYFIHYSVFENYPVGTIKQFDRTSLVNQFDKIRRTLVVNQ